MGYSWALSYLAPHCGIAMVVDIAVLESSHIPEALCHIDDPRDLSILSPVSTPALLPDAGKHMVLLHNKVDQNGGLIDKFIIAVLTVKDSEFSFPFRVISYEEGKALAESWNAAFLESSAKENQVYHL